jgi:NAD(P)-dependent dehydrogenase (short-subunit alcohol dehydrogenase family)
MVTRGRGGAIVNIGSMWAKQAVQATPSSAYSMAKAGLHSLTQHLAMELASAKVRVNAVSPAVVETAIYEAFIPRAQVHEAHLGSPAPFGMSMAASWLGATNISWRSVQDHLRRPAMGRNHAAPCAFQNRSRLGYKFVH